MVFKKWAVVAGAALLCTSILVAGVSAVRPAAEASLERAVIADAVKTEAVPGNLAEAPDSNVAPAQGAVRPNVSATPAVGNADASATPRIKAPVATSTNNSGIASTTPAVVTHRAPKFQKAVRRSGMTLGTRAITFDGTPGTDAPPDTLGGFVMTPFPAVSETGEVDGVDSPCPTGGRIMFSPNMEHGTIGDGWNTWSHGYTGDIWHFVGYAELTELTLTLPAGSCAFYLYVEPNDYQEHLIECIANEGLADEVGSGQIPVVGDSGAKYFGFYGEELQTITVRAAGSARGFAVGEFGLACFCEPIYVACCIEESGACTDNVDLLDCIDQGGRFDVDAVFCDDLVPACGALTGACCQGGEAEPPYDPWECIGDMTLGECLALGESTFWTEGASCDDVGFSCCEYCSAGSDTDIDEYITRIVLGTIDNPSDYGDGGYEDFTALSTVLIPGTEVDFELHNAEYFDTDAVDVWIDTNFDCDFDDEGELVFSEAQTEAVTMGSFTVPAVSVETRIRFCVRYGGTNPTADPCAQVAYGEYEDYTVIIDGNAMGACCDPATGVCTDNVAAADCAAPLQFSYETLCADLDTACGDPGACCDPFTGVCTDDTLALDCQAPLVHYSGESCDELDPMCGNPGACCDDDTAICTEEFKLNCTGRFVAGATCDPDPFTPACGEWVPTGFLFAPTQDDNPEFRDALATILNSDVDYFDARSGTPTLEELMPYACVMTWVDFPYSDSVAMGDVLADFVDIGGKVILGQWTYPSTQRNWLEGRIMTADYCPVIVEDYSDSGGSYQGDGVDCVHADVTAYQTGFLDAAVLNPATPGAWSDGTFSTGDLAVAWRGDRGVYYSPGNTGGRYADALDDWAQLTANMCICPGGPIYGACCDLETGTCQDNVELFDCLDLYENPKFTWDTLCADLIPACGNPGACCDPFTGVCTDDVLELNCLPPLQHFPGESCEELDPLCGNPGCCCVDFDSEIPFEEFELNCAGRFLPGVIGAECVTAAFNPVCGTPLPLIDLSVGTDAPPVDLFGCDEMTPFPPDDRPLFDDVTTIPWPCPVGGDLEFSAEISHRRIGDGWLSWSHDYTGDVYFTNGATEIEFTLPEGSCGIYFYVEPDPFQDHTFKVLVDDFFESDEFVANGSAGAAYCGIYYPAGISTVKVTCTSGVAFSIGEFGACCDCVETPVCDLDSDSDVDWDDYNIIRDAFGSCDGDAAYDAAADIDDDGCVTWLDYQEFWNCFAEYGPQ